MRRSHAQRELEPTAERVAADRGDHRSRDRRQRVDARGGTQARSRCDASGSVNSLMSAPAANAWSLPVTTTAFTVASAASCSARVGDRVEQRARQRVQRRTVEPHDRDTVVVTLGDARDRGRRSCAFPPELSEQHSRPRCTRRCRAPRPARRGGRRRRRRRRVVGDRTAAARARCRAAPRGTRAARRRASSSDCSRCARCARSRATARRRPSPSVATVATIGGRHARAPASSSIASRSLTVSCTPARSALFTTKMSAISSSPAFAACTSSPQPGFTTTTVVSAWPAISTSTWPTPTVSTTTHGLPTASSTATACGVATRAHRGAHASPSTG